MKLHPAPVAQHSHRDTEAQRDRAAACALPPRLCVSVSLWLCSSCLSTAPDAARRATETK